MSNLTDKWAKQWKVKRKSILNKHFSVQSVINHQINNKSYEWPSLCRDLEMRRLENSSTFTPNSAENAEDDSTTPVLSCKFCPLPGFDNVVASVTEHGNVYLTKSLSGKPETTVTKAHNNAIFDLLWVPGEKKVLTLSGDLTARLWDVGQDSMRLVSMFVGHKKSVKAADFIPGDSAIFASGSRDGNIHVWDMRSSKGVDNQFKPDQTITLAAHMQRKGKLQHSSASVTALVFRDSHNLLCSGATDEFIRIWDMRKTHCPWKITEPKGYLRSGKSGYTDLKLNKERTKLYASSITSSIYSFNLNSSRESPIAEFNGHQSGTFYIRISVSKDGDYLASGSMDKNVYVWKTASAELQDSPRSPMLCLSGHKAEVTGIDTSHANRTTIVSCGDDGTVRMWTPTACTSEEPTFSNVAVSEKAGPSSLLDLKELLSIERENGSDSKENEEFKSRVDRSLRESTPPWRAVRTDELPTTAKRKFQETSPVRSASCSSKRSILSPNKSNSEYRSPTMHLPNYVLEGTGPSHSCPSFKQKESRNWLLEMQERSAGKQSVSAEKSGKRQRTMNGKRSSRKTLLEYYKKSSKSIDDSLK